VKESSHQFNNYYFNNYYLFNNYYFNNYYLYFVKESSHQSPSNTSFFLCGLQGLGFVAQSLCAAFKALVLWSSAFKQQQSITKQTLKLKKLQLSDKSDTK